MNDEAVRAELAALSGRGAPKLVASVRAELERKLRAAAADNASIALALRGS